MENDRLEARLSILETRMASLEARQAILEGHIGAVTKPKSKRELTPEEKKAIRARLVAGQEKARAKREADTKAQAKAAKNDKKEATPHER